MTAARIVADRIWPVRKGRPIRLDFPENCDPIAAMDVVFQGLGKGAISPEEAQAAAWTVLAHDRLSRAHLHDPKDTGSHVVVYIPDNGRDREPRTDLPMESDLPIGQPPFAAQEPAPQTQGPNPPPPPVREPDEDEPEDEPEDDEPEDDELVDLEPGPVIEGEAIEVPAVATVEPEPEPEVIPPSRPAQPIPQPTPAASYRRVYTEQDRARWRALAS